MNLRTLVEKAPMSRKMISFAAQRLMELKVESQSGAAYGEKNPQRLAQRNGYAAFGSFIVRKNLRIDRNPNAGAEVPISLRRVIVFKASPIMKQRVNGVGSSTQSPSGLAL